MKGKSGTIVRADGERIPLTSHEPDARCIEEDGDIYIVYVNTANGSLPKMAPGDQMEIAKGDFRLRWVIC